MKRAKAGGGWRAIWYTIRKSREAGGFIRMYKALRSKNACKTCALGMGGQLGGMVNEQGRFPEVCKKSIQAMTADMQGALREHFFDDFSLETLRGMTPRELEAAGRLTHPVIAGPLDSHYRAISWDEVLDKVADTMKKTPPDEAFFYLSGRSSNEAGFLLQLLARIYGTNHVNNCSYYCHQASGVGLDSVTGSGTATVVLEDIESCDLLFIIGANPSSNHPRLMRSLVELRRRGGKVIVVNPVREVGLERFNVPSDVRSLLFGSKIADLYVQPHIGGDIAFMTGVAKALLERDVIDDEFVDNFTDGWDACRAGIESTSWDDIISTGGVDRETIDRVADMYCVSQRTIFSWAMGVTHHVHGVENVQMIGNLAMMRGMLGRTGRGLLPLRGHSNVQGIGSMGVTPALKQAVFERLEQTFEVKLPTSKGLDTLGCLDQGREGRMRLAWCLGGNLYGATPDSTAAAKAFANVGTVVYLSTTLNTGHAWGCGRETIILPVQARDEESQTTTQESMFNYVRLSDGGESRYDGPRSEVDIIAGVGQRLFGADGPIDWTAMREHGNIRSAIARIIPGYEAIGEIDRTRNEFYISGRVFHEPQFPTDNGRAKFHAVELPDLPEAADRTLRLMTVRSEGQFNTVVYEDHDIYRGQDRRDVLMINEADRRRLDLEIDQRVTVSSVAGTLTNLLVRTIDVAPGNAVMYYPEANTLIPADADRKSHTPAFKNVLVEITPATGETPPEREPALAVESVPRRDLKRC
jgi:molybdopterin-dependent oxidoreductase alpha subunit